MNFTEVGRSWRKSKSHIAPQWSQRRLVVPSGSFSSELTPRASSVYRTSRYPTIPLQLLHLAAQYILSDIASLVAGETSRADEDNGWPLDRDQNAPRVWSVVVSHWVSLESVLLKCTCTAISGRGGTPLGGRASRSNVFVNFASSDSTLIATRTPSGIYLNFGRWLVAAAVPGPTCPVTALIRTLGALVIFRQSTLQPVSILCEKFAQSTGSSWMSRVIRAPEAK